MHSAGLELTKMTHTRLEDNLIRHRGDRLISIPNPNPCNPDLNQSNPVNRCKHSPLCLGRSQQSYASTLSRERVNLFLEQVVSSTAPGAPTHSSVLILRILYLDPTLEGFEIRSIGPPTRMNVPTYIY